MSHGKLTTTTIGSWPTHNTARFFTENRHVAWVAARRDVLWGIYGYIADAEAQGPAIPVRVAAAICRLARRQRGDGSSSSSPARSRRRIAENSQVEQIESTSRSNVAIVYVTLARAGERHRQGVRRHQAEARRHSRTCRQARGPIEFIKDFGDTAALMLTVASPKADDVEVSAPRARIAESAIRRRDRTGRIRPSRVPRDRRVPESISPTIPRRSARSGREPHAASAVLAQRHSVVRRPRLRRASTCETALDDGALVETLQRAAQGTACTPPSSTPIRVAPVVVGDPARPSDGCARVAAASYTYRELDEFTDLDQADPAERRRRCRRSRAPAC